MSKHTMARLEELRKKALTASKPAPSRIDLDRSVGERDRRKDRAQGRTEQLNIKSQAVYVQLFDDCLAEEKERRGLLNLSRGHFLEYLLAMWQQNKGKPIPPFGLSAGAAASAKLIAQHVGEDDLGKVIEDALAQRAKQFGLVGKKIAS